MVHNHGAERLGGLAMLIHGPCSLPPTHSLAMPSITTVLAHPFAVRGTRHVERRIKSKDFTMPSLFVPMNAAASARLCGVVASRGQTASDLEQQRCSLARCLGCREAGWRRMRDGGWFSLFSRSLGSAMESDRWTGTVLIGLYPPGVMVGKERLVMWEAGGIYPVGLLTE
ncbi:hypothetical protein IWZ01DRAFT_504886 [Phyllosticta capitalensis]